MKLGRLSVYIEVLRYGVVCDALEKLADVGDVEAMVLLESLASGRVVVEADIDFLRRRGARCHVPGVKN